MIELYNLEKFLKISNDFNSNGISNIALFINNVSKDFFNFDSLFIFNSSIYLLDSKSFVCFRLMFDQNYKLDVLYSKRCNSRDFAFKEINYGIVKLIYDLLILKKINKFLDN